MSTAPQHAAPQTTNPSGEPPLSPALALIAAERIRQVSAEGWTVAHDDHHDQGDLAAAAACYAMPESRRPLSGTPPVPGAWPWEAGWWKPTPDDRLRELAKAGALILAEMERLQRRAEQDVVVSVENGRTVITRADGTRMGAQG